MRFCTSAPPAASTPWGIRFKGTATPPPPPALALPTAPLAEQMLQFMTELMRRDQAASAEREALRLEASRASAECVGLAR